MKVEGENFSRGEYRCQIENEVKNSNHQVYPYISVESKQNILRQTSSYIQLSETNFQSNNKICSKITLEEI